MLPTSIGRYEHLAHSQLFAADRRTIEKQAYHKQEKEKNGKTNAVCTRTERGIRKRPLNDPTFLIERPGV